MVGSGGGWLVASEIRKDIYRLPFNSAHIIGDLAI